MLPGAAENEEEEEGGDEAELLVPLPTEGEPVVAGHGDADVVRGFFRGFDVEGSGCEESDGEECQRAEAADGRVP